MPEAASNQQNPRGSPEQTLPPGLRGHQPGPHLDLGLWPQEPWDDGTLLAFKPLSVWFLLRQPWQMSTESGRNLEGISVDSSEAHAGSLLPRNKGGTSTQQTPSNPCHKAPDILSGL